MIISLAAVLIAGISASYAYRQSAVQEKPFKHARPRIRVDLAYTGDVQRNPELIIMNNGPLSVASIAVDYHCYLYDKSLKKIAPPKNGSGFRQDLTSFTKSLDPAETVRIALSGFQEPPSEPLIGVVVLQMRYYRALDLEEYNGTETFFIEGERMSRQEEFASSPDYGNIMRAIGSRRYAPVQGETKNSRTVIARWVVRN